MTCNEVNASQSESKYSIIFQPAGFGRGHSDPGGYFINWSDKPRGVIQIHGFKTEVDARFAAEELIEKHP